MIAALRRDLAACLPLMAALVVLHFATARRAAGEIAVDAGFPGGNIRVERIEGDRIEVRQDLRDTTGDWFYWCFRVRGAAGRTIDVHFTGSNVIGVRGPAVSLDGGKTWRWLGAEACKGTSFRFDVPSGAHEARFAMGIPYLESNLAAFIERHRGSGALRVETLCHTSKGRDVELLRVGQLDREPEHRVLLTARHHACEAMASYVLEGLLSTVIADPDDGAWLRNHVEFLAVPFMDKDGVEEGDQGKNRRPHDHNRDYVQQIYPSVKSLMKRAAEWSDGKLRIAFDLHCPYIRGDYNEFIYFVGGKDPANWGEITRFSEILQRRAAGPLPYRAGDNLPFGKAWNTGTGDESLRSCSSWTSTLPGVQLSASLEIPYANVLDREVTEDGARLLGEDLARAIRTYLER